MTHQMELPMSRSTDPASSYDAAEQLIQSGRHNDQLRIVLDTVRSWPGQTSRELAQHCELDRYQIARRLPELEQMGLVRKGVVRACSAGGRQAATWWRR